MLHAILNGKTGNLDVPVGQGRAFFRDWEDSLTSMVFERLRYLPIEIFWEVISSTVRPKDILPLSPGNFDADRSVFWPRWESVGLSAEKQRNVIPDVLLCFDKIDLIIEAKRSDGGGQGSEQLAQEWVGYFKSGEGEPEKSVCLLAIGGLPDTEEEKWLISTRLDIQRQVGQSDSRMFPVQLVGTSWLRIVRMLHELAERKDLMPHCVIVIHDILTACDQLYGISYREPVWLSSLPRAINDRELGQLRSESAKALAVLID
jgi:hypothetical protein